MHAMKVTKMNRWGLVLLCAVVAACSGGDDPSVAGDPQNQQPGPRGLPAPAPECAVDGDCGEGSGCALPAGACVAFAEEGQVFSVLVKPQGDTDLLPDQYAGVPVGAGGRLDLTMDDPIEIRGVAVFGNSDLVAATGQAPANAETVGGYLVATAPGLIPGTQFRSETKVYASLAQANGLGEIAEMEGTDTEAGYQPTFVLRLLPGLTYSLAFIPDLEDDDLPDLPVHDVSAQFSKSGRFDIVLPSRKQYLDAKFTGLVVLDEAGSQPVEGARVTGSVGDGTSGTTATTDGLGVFTLVLPPGQGLVTLRVEPGQSSPPFPEFEFVYAEGLTELAAMATPRFVVGPVPPEREIILQVVNVTDDSLVPVPQARVEAHGQAAGGKASGFGIAGSDGVVKMTLLEGVYSLTIMPPAGSMFASNQTVLDLETKKNEEVFVVPLGRREKIQGRILRMEGGEGVPGAVVTLQTNQVSAFEGAQQGTQDFSVDVVTDAIGGFEVYVDPGLYAISVVPPAWSGLARFSQPSVDLTVGDAALNVSLPDGALVRGHLQRIDADGKAVPLDSAQVQFYFEAPEDKLGGGYWALDQTSFATAIQLAGSSTVDDQGAFSLVVPQLDLTLIDGGEPRPGTDPPYNGDATSKSAYGLPAVEVIPDDAEPAEREPDSRSAQPAS